MRELWFDKKVKVNIINNKKDYNSKSLENLKFLKLFGEKPF